MAVPKFYEFMPSIIRCLGDKREHTAKEILEFCINDLKLTENDKAETITSGQSRLTNRVAWARVYLKKAGLIDSPQRAHFKLTKNGIAALNNGADLVNLEYLNQFDSFKEFSNKGAESKNGNTNSNIIKSESPQEQIELALQNINEELADDLMSEIMKISPYAFESLVVKLLIAMGYGKMEENKDAVTPKSGDEGIDGIVSADKFGFDSIYVQAKRWKQDNTVGEPEIQKFLGALSGQGATKGIFITTSQFSKKAVSFAQKILHSKIVLVDGKQLTNLMIEYNLGVSTVATYNVKRLDSDFFEDNM